MTTNQIAYYKAKEEERHNREMERETQRSNYAREQLEKASQNITKVHYGHQDAETTRSNRAQEQLKETAIGVDYAKLSETRRSNLANESIARTNAQTNRIKANSGAYLDYATSGLRFAETGLKDLEASYRIAQTQLTEAQTKHELASYYNTIEQVGLTQAQREHTQMQTNMLPIETWGKAVGSMGTILRAGNNMNLGGSDYGTETAQEAATAERNYIQLK